MGEAMKKTVLLIVGIIFSFPMAMAQEIIENPEKAGNAKAGRIVTLSEDMRIADTGEGFYFKNPFTIRVSPRDDIFIYDGQEQALQFDARGRFVRNLFKKGQGPGELTVLYDIWASSDRLYLFGYPSKILIFNYDGSLDKELSTRDVGTVGKFIWSDSDGILMSKSGRPDPAAGNGLRDFPQDIVEISTRDSTVTKISSFPIRAFIEFFPGGAASVRAWNQLHAVSLDERILVLNYTPEYRLEMYDREKGAIVRRFDRPYVRVKKRGGAGISSTGGNRPPEPEFQTDIFSLHVVDGKTWVQTSTIVEGKGILFDVFDRGGRYVDSFYVQSPQKDASGKPANQMLTIANGFAYGRERTEDELIVIKKYRLVGF